MSIFLPWVVEQLIIEHYVFPGDGRIEVEFDLINFVARLHMDEEVGVIENGIDEQVWTFLDSIHFSSRGLNENILRDSSFAGFEEHPAVDTFAKVQIRSELIRLVIIDIQSFGCEFFCFLFFGLDLIFVECAFGHPFDEN